MEFPLKLPTERLNNNADVYYRRGNAYFRAGDRDKADADLATAKRLEAGQ